MNDEKKVPESFKTYEEGKHRRYTLLFAVNGGAFALAKFIADKVTQSMGGLKLSYLCYGMALFTIVMCMDIFMFGLKMRRIICRILLVGRARLLWCSSAFLSVLAGFWSL